MLSITDLHNEQELSSSEMDQVAGGCDSLNQSIAAAAGAAADVFLQMGCGDAAFIMEKAQLDAQHGPIPQ